jgi:hypothetical protein
MQANLMQLKQTGNRKKKISVTGNTDTGRIKFCSINKDEIKFTTSAYSFLEKGINEIPRGKRKKCQRKTGIGGGSHCANHYKQER